jgi:hypothetical protein
MIVVLAILITVVCGVTSAIPERLNYQGVLRDASGNPLDGSFDMVFRYYSAETGGTFYLMEEHLDPGAGGTGRVTVTGGLFSVVLGTGQLVDVTGGALTTLGHLFQQYEVWLEVQVGSEILSPRVQFSAAGFSLNAAKLAGWKPDHYLDTSNGDQTKNGAITANSSFASHYGLNGYGPLGGGYFEDKNDSGIAHAGYGDFGVWASGADAGGYFTDPDTGVWARVGEEGWGLRTTGGVLADGEVRVGGAIYNLHPNIYLNHDGPDGDSSMYFFENGWSDGARMFWNDGSTRFEFSEALRVPDVIRGTSFHDDDNIAYFLDPAASLSGVLEGNLVIGHGSASDTDSIQFDQQAESFSWNNSKTRFEVTDELAVSGALQTGGTGLTSVGYNRMGTGVPAAASDMSTTDDLFVTETLEVGSILGLSHILMMEASDSPGADGDQSIYFYDQDHRATNYLRWDDISSITCGTLGNVSSGFLWNIADNLESGWVFANGADNEAVIDEIGNLEIDGTLSQSGSCDLAETFFGPAGLTAGTVVVLDTERPEGVRESYKSNDGSVAGVVTTRPGVLLSGPSADAYPVWKELQTVGEMLAALPPETELSPLESDGRTTPALNDERSHRRAQRAALEQRASDLETELDGWARGDVAVALVGRVPVKADASYASIRKGDYLTTSETPGHARRLEGPGPYLGIAMDELASGKGEVLVFLSKGWYGGTVDTDTAPSAVKRAPKIAETQTMESGLEIVLDHDANERSRFTVHKDGGNGLSSEVFRIDERGNVFATGSFRPAAMDVAEFHAVSEPVGVGDVLVADRGRPGYMALGRLAADRAVTGIVSTDPGVLLGSGLRRIADADPEMALSLEIARAAGDRDEQARLWAELEARFEKTHAAIALSGTVPCKVDAGYGSIRVGDLLTVSPTAGHAMRAADPAPQGTVLGKALESLEAGTGTIKVLVMNR